MKKIYFILYIVSLVLTLAAALYVFGINRDLSVWLVVIPALLWVVFGALYRNEKMKENLSRMEQQRKEQWEKDNKK